MSAVTDHLQESIDMHWYIYCGTLVFLMQLGFAMLEVGSVRKKNSKNILIKNFMDACIGALMWWACGYLIAFGTNSERDEFAGSANLSTNQYLFLANSVSVKDYQFWFFQFAFAATAASITSGAVAERCQMSAYFMYSSILVGFIYPVVVHWCWSKDGFLSNFALSDDDGTTYNAGRNWSSIGVIDFAGSGVVHLTGGVCAFVGAWTVGPRTGRFVEGELVTKGFTPQSSAFQALGTFILWFGWYAFNCGSTLGLWPGAPTVAARVAVTTTISAAACAVTSCFIGYIVSGTGEYSLPAVANGILAGLVSITAGCPVVEPWAAFIIGVIGAFIYHGWSTLMIRMNIDDVVDAVAVHGACGAWGVIAAALFAKNDLICEYAVSLCEGEAGYRNEQAGLFYSTNGKLLGTAALQIICIIGWVGVTMGIAFQCFNLLDLLRVSEEDEFFGLDASHHGGIDDEYVNSLGIDALVKMKDEGAKLDKFALLAMCIDQNVNPLPILVKFDEASKGSSSINDSAGYDSLIEMVTPNSPVKVIDVDFA